MSPRLRDQSVGPKPTMYCVTFTPNCLAGTMWPTSCRAIDSSRPTAKISTPSAYSMSHLPSTQFDEREPSRRARSARPAVSLFDVLDGTRVPGAMRGCSLSHSSSTVGDGVDDLQEPDRPSWKAATQLLVGGVVDRRGAPARRARPPGERHGRERRRRPAARTSSAARSSSRWRRGVGHPRRASRARARSCSRMSGGDDLRERRAVGELDHGVHDRLRVDDDLDALVRDVEQQVRLDHLQALVHQRRRIRRDELCPSSQVGWASACCRRDVGQLVDGCGRGTVRRWR